MATPENGGRVAVVGTLNIDLIWQVPCLPRPGQTILACHAERQFGGKGANQAVAAARQGAAVMLFGAVGDDAEGGAYREHLQSEGIDVTCLATAPGVATGTAHVYVDPGGENLIVVNQGANAHLEASRLAEIMGRSDVVLVQLEAPLAAVSDALRAAATAQVRSVLNASPAAPDFPWGSVAIDTVIVNEHECVDCFGTTPSELGRLDDSAVRGILGARGVSHLVVTQGGDPTLHFSAGGRDVVPAYAVQPRDTVGAGDTFAGALAAELARGRAWTDALWHANVAAALSTLAIGAQAAMPTRTKVEAAIKKKEAGL